MNPDDPARWDPDTREPLETPIGPDPVGVVAVGIGFVGIVFLGIVCAIAAAVLGAVAGQRARATGRSFELPYLAFILAAIDGLVWIVLHYLFKLPIQFG